MTTISFRPFRKRDQQACLDLFDSNFPEYFAPHERKEYKQYLEDPPEGYEVCELNGHVVGAFGLIDESHIEKRLHWIMVDAQAQGKGVGNEIMQRVINLGRSTKTEKIGLETTQKVAPFFEKYGAKRLFVTKDGFGLGLDCIVMELVL